MANYASLKSAIQAVIKQNGNNEITGALLQQSLLSMINSLGADFQFAGVATPATNPGTPDQRVFYIAGVPGVYVNFGNQNVAPYQIGVFYYDTQWNFSFIYIRSIGNVLAAADSTGVFADIDTENMTISILPLGGALNIGNGHLSAPSNRTISLTGIDYPIVAVTYDFSTQTVQSEDERSVTPGRVVLAVIRTNASMNPTEIVSVNSPFAITIDGHSSDRAVQNLESDVKHLKEIVPENNLVTGNVVFVNSISGNTYPTFDLVNKTFMWPSGTGGIYVGNVFYPGPSTPEERTVSLSVVSTVGKIIYNTVSHTLSAKVYDYPLTKNEVVIASYRFNNTIEPRRIVSINASFIYGTIGDVLAPDTFGGSNVLMAADANGVFANINKTNMTFTITPAGGVIVIGRTAYPAPSVESRTVSMLGVNYPVIAITYKRVFTGGTVTAQIYAEDPRNITNGELVLAIVRTNASMNPTEIVSVNASFPVRINMVNPDAVIEQLVSDVVDLNDRIDELEVSPEPPMLPYMEIFKSIPSSEIDTEFQSFCKVGNEIWIFTGGSGAGGALTGYIYRYTLAWEYISRFQQNGFHFNSVSYDEITDRLITGQAGDGSNHIYVFNNVSNWPTTHAASPVTSADIERVVVVSQVNNRPNPVWGPRNAYGHRDIFISANLNSKFLKIRLGYGTNQLQYGTYTASADGVPNGTYQLVWVRELTIPQLIYTIAAKIPAYPTAVCQGIAYYNGKIYVMATVTPSTIMEITPTDNALTCRVIYQLWTDDEDNIIENCANEGIMCLDGKMYVGVSAIGVDTQITNYNNKILRFDL